MMKMKWIAQIAAVAVAAWTTVVPAPAPAEASPELRNSKVDFAYIPPKSVKYYAMLERLKKRQFLEQLSEFVSPVRFPHPFYLITTECGVVNAFYSFSQWAIFICYEWIEEMDRIAPPPGQPVDGITHDDVVIGETVATVLHELGHAAFDMLRMARTIVNGEAYFWYKSPNPEKWAHYADEHGTAGQRYYNTLCLAYGGDPASFKDFVDKNWLPADRAKNCAAEFQQIRSAFIKTVLPFIDPEMMKQVQARQWLPPQDKR